MVAPQAEVENRGGRSLAWMAATVILLLAAFVALPSLVPQRHQVESHWGSDGVNWFGHPQWLAFFFAVALLVLLCFLRFVIITRVRCPAEAITWYLLLLAALLPAVWLLVVVDWDNEAVAAIGNWIGTPITLFVVPTAFAFYDAIAGVRLSAGWYAARSLVEVVVLVPVWAVLWVLVGEMFLLGWFGF
jgi:hypothetical protein